MMPLRRMLTTFPHPVLTYKADCVLKTIYVPTTFSLWHMQHFHLCRLFCVSAPYTQAPQAYPGQVASAYSQAGAPTGHPQQQQQQYPSYAQPAQGRGQCVFVLCGCCRHTFTVLLRISLRKFWLLFLWRRDSLLVECRTCDCEVASSSSCMSSRKIFFSRVNFLC